MKKKIVIGIFLLLIVATAILFLDGAIKSYRYDMDPENGVDIMRGFGAAILLVLGGYLVFYECDLFYTVYFFCFKPKTVVYSILNVLSNLSLAMIGVVFCLDYVPNAPHLPEASVPILLFVYGMLRCICLAISAVSSVEPI